jgi:hypothetical protein
MAEQHGSDHYDATFARDLAWAQKLREQLDELPTTDEDDETEAR